MISILKPVTMLLLCCMAAGPLRAGSMEGDREFSGKPFMEMQNKAREVKLDFTPGPSAPAPFKLSAPAKRKTLASHVPAMPPNSESLAQGIRDAQEQMFRALDLAMTLTITGIGVVFGGLAANIPGAVVGGAFAYGVWTVAKKTR